MNRTINIDMEQKKTPIKRFLYNTENTNKKKAKNTDEKENPKVNTENNKMKVKNNVELEDTKITKKALLNTENNNMKAKNNEPLVVIEKPNKLIDNIEYKNNKKAKNNLNDIEKPNIETTKNKKANKQTNISYKKFTKQSIPTNTHKILEDDMEDYTINCESIEKFFKNNQDALYRINETKSLFHLGFDSD